MKIKGEVTSGFGKAAFFLSQEFYIENFKKTVDLSLIQVH